MISSTFKTNDNFNVDIVYSISKSLFIFLFLYNLNFFSYVEYILVNHLSIGFNLKLFFLFYFIYSFLKYLKNYSYNLMLLELDDVNFEFFFKKYDYNLVLNHLFFQRIFSDVLDNITLYTFGTDIYFYKFYNKEDIRYQLLKDFYYYKYNSNIENFRFLGSKSFFEINNKDYNFILSQKLYIRDFFKIIIFLFFVFLIKFIYYYYYCF